MNTDSSLMGWLEPPDHGLSELKGKIARRASRRKTVAGVAATAAVALGSIAILQSGGESFAPPAMSEREWRAAISAQNEQLRVINGASLELSAPDADTRIYLVSTIPKRASEESG